MEMKRAGEIMMPLSAFPYIPYWFTLRQALAELEDQENKRKLEQPVPWLILVFSAQNQLLGIVRRQNILQGLRPGVPNKLRDQFPSLSDTADLDLYRMSFSQEKAYSDLRNQIERKILEFMTPIQATVDYCDPALLAIYMMIDHNLTFVPVVENGQIAGIVYAEDALHEVITHIV